MAEQKQEHLETANLRQRQNLNQKWISDPGCETGFSD